MSAVAYAMSDFAGVRVPEDRGGCGAEHQAQVDDRGRKFVECDGCVPHLVGNVYGFSAAPQDVPLTPDETAARQAAEGDARMSQSGLLNTLAARMAPSRSIADQVAGMSDAERAELRQVLAGKTR